MIFLLAYLGIGVLILVRDMKYFSGEKDPPPSIRPYVDGTRDMIEARPWAAGPIFFFATVILWGPIILYGIFEHFYEGDDSYD